MGQQYFYCQTCGTRITGDDLESGGAQRTSTRIRCVECAKKKTQRKLRDVIPTVPADPAP
jgi:hypothetical protein